MLNFKLNNNLKDLQNEIGEDHYRTFGVILNRAHNYYHLGILTSISCIALLVIDIFYFESERETV